MKATSFFCAVLILCTTMAWSQTTTKYPGTEPNVELRISVNRHPVLGERDMENMERKGLIENAEQARAIYQKNVISIMMGQSLQLKVDMIETDGTITDVTHSPATLYNVLGDGRDLITNTSGLITAVFSQEKYLLTGEVFIIHETPEKSGYNMMFFDVKRP